MEGIKVSLKCKHSMAGIMMPTSGSALYFNSRLGFLIKKRRSVMGVKNNFSYQRLVVYCGCNGECHKLKFLLHGSSILLTSVF